MEFEITPEGGVAIRPKEGVKLPSAQEIGKKAKEIKEKAQDILETFFTAKKIGKKVTLVARLVSPSPKEPSVLFKKDRALVTGLLDGLVDLASQKKQLRERVLEKVLPREVKNKGALSKELSNFLVTPTVDLEHTREKAGIIMDKFGFSEKEQDLILGLSTLFEQIQPPAGEGQAEGGWTPPDWLSVSRGEAPSPPPGPERGRREERPEERRVEEEIKRATGQRSEYLKERRSLYWKTALIGGLLLWFEVAYGFGPVSKIVWPALQEAEVNPPVIGRVIEKIPGGVGEEIVEAVPTDIGSIKDQVNRALTDPGYLRTFVVVLPNDAARGTEGIEEFRRNKNKLQFPDQWNLRLEWKMKILDRKVKKELQEFAQKKDPSIIDEIDAANWFSEWLREKPGYSGLIDETDALESIYIAFKTGEPIPDDKFEQIKKLVKEVTGSEF